MVRFVRSSLDMPDPDIAAAPEVVHVLLLRGEQLLEPLVFHAIQGPLGAAAEFFGRSRWRRMVDHVFGKVDRAAWLGLDREGDLAGVLGVDSLVGMRALGLQRMVSGTRQGQAALFGRMAQHDPTVLGIAGSVMEYRCCKNACLAGIMRVARALGSLAAISEEITMGASALRSVTR